MTKQKLTARQKRLFTEFMDHAQAALKCMVDLREIEENQRLFRMRQIVVSKKRRPARKNC